MRKICLELNINFEESLLSPTFNGNFINSNSSHKSIIGQIDKKSLFYMRSRGFSEKTAKGLLTFAFLIEVIEKLNTKEIVDYAKTEIAKKLSIEKDLL